VIYTGTESMWGFVSQGMIADGRTPNANIERRTPMKTRRRSDRRLFLCSDHGSGRRSVLQRGAAGPQSGMSRDWRPMEVLRWVSRQSPHAHALERRDEYRRWQPSGTRSTATTFFAHRSHTLLDRERWIDPVVSKGGQRALDKLRAQFPQGWIDERPGENGVSRFA